MFESDQCVSLIICAAVSTNFDGDGAEILNEDKLTRVCQVVYSLDLEKPWTRQFLHNSGLHIFPASGRAYHVRFLEVQRRLIEADVSIGETEIANGSSVMVFSDDDLVKELGKLGVAIESLELPHKSNYPI